MTNKQFQGYKKKGRKKAYEERELKRLWDKNELSRLASRAGMCGLSEKLKEPE